MRIANPLLTNGAGSQKFNRLFDDVSSSLLPSSNQGNTESTFTYNHQLTTSRKTTEEIMKEFLDGDLDELSTEPTSTHHQQPSNYEQEANSPFFDLSPEDEEMNFPLSPSLILNTSGLDPMSLDSIMEPSDLWEGIHKAASTEQHASLDTPPFSEKDIVQKVEPVLKRRTRKPTKSTPKPQKRKELSSDDDEEDEPQSASASSEYEKQASDSVILVCSDEEEDDDGRASHITDADRRVMGDAQLWKTIHGTQATPGRFYGHIEDVLTVYEKRIECTRSQTHRPPQCGISGNGNAGEAAESIVASSMGGYGDEDMGEIMIYTGQGGSETEDQTLNSVNKSLTLNMSKKTPVRVVRGYQLRTKYAPKTGYRYDGLYWVTKYWTEPQILSSGRKGAKVYRFRLVRLEDQPTIPELDEKSIPTHVKSTTRTQYKSTYAKGLGKVKAEPSVGSRRKRRKREPTRSYVEEEEEEEEVMEEDCLLARQLQGKSNTFLKSPIINSAKYYYFRERELAITKHNSKFGHVTSQYDRVSKSSSHILRFQFNIPKGKNAEKPLAHWHGSSSEFSEFPLLTRNEPDGIFMESIERQLKYVYKHGQAVVGFDALSGEMDNVIDCMLNEPTKQEQQTNTLQAALECSPAKATASVTLSQPTTDLDTSSTPLFDEDSAVIQRPYRIQKASNGSNGSLISTSYMLSEINSLELLQFLRGVEERGFKKNTTYEDILLNLEMYLVGEREKLKTEIQVSGFSTLLERKQEHFERLRDIAKKL